MEKIIIIPYISEMRGIGGYGSAWLWTAWAFVGCGLAVWLLSAVAWLWRLCRLPRFLRRGRAARAPLRGLCACFLPPSPPRPPSNPPLSWGVWFIFFFAYAKKKMLYLGGESRGGQQSHQTRERSRCRPQQAASTKRRRGGAQPRPAARGYGVTQTTKNKDLTTGRTMLYIQAEV
jgi:hypothetical protein